MTTDRFWVYYFLIGFRQVKVNYKEVKPHPHNYLANIQRFGDNQIPKFGNSDITSLYGNLFELQSFN